MEAFITKIIEANNRGISAITNLTVEPNWSFGQAVFFSGTVLTTIGKKIKSQLDSKYYILKCKCIVRIRARFTLIGEW